MNVYVLYIEQSKEVITFFEEKNPWIEELALEKLDDIVQSNDTDTISVGSDIQFTDVVAMMKLLSWTLFESLIRCQDTPDEQGEEITLDDSTT